MLRTHCAARTAGLSLAQGILRKEATQARPSRRIQTSCASGNQARMVSMWRRCSGVFSTTRRAPLARAKLASSTANTAASVSGAAAVSAAASASRSRARRRSGGIWWMRAATASGPAAIAGASWKRPSRR